MAHETGSMPLGFNDATFSDWKLEIALAEENDVRPKKRAKRNSSLRQFHVNSLILARESEFFKYGYGLFQLDLWFVSSCLMPVQISGFSFWNRFGLSEGRSCCFRQRIRDWPYDEKIIRMLVKPGEEQYAEQLLLLMYGGVLPYSKGTIRSLL